MQVSVCDRYSSITISTDFLCGKLEQLAIPCTAQVNYVMSSVTLLQAERLVSQNRVAIDIKARIWAAPNSFVLYLDGSIMLLILANR